MGKSYLVTGAELRCIWGSKPGTLGITQGHNCVADGREKANCSDSRKAGSYTHFRAHETGRNFVCRLLPEKKK